MGRKGNIVIEHNGNSETEKYKLVAQRQARVCTRLFYFAALCLGAAATANAQTDPWSNAATRLGTIFTGPIAKGLALVALVVGGLQISFSENGSHRTVAGLLFGLGAALGAANLIAYLFS